MCRQNCKWDVWRGEQSIHLGPLVPLLLHACSSGAHNHKRGPNPKSAVPSPPLMFHFNDCNRVATTDTDRTSTTLSTAATHWVTCTRVVGVRKSCCCRRRNLDVRSVHFPMLQPHYTVVHARDRKTRRRFASERSVTTTTPLRTFRWKRTAAFARIFSTWRRILKQTACAFFCIDRQIWNLFTPITGAERFSLKVNTPRSSSGLAPGFSVLVPQQFRNTPLHFMVLTIT